MTDPAKGSSDEKVTVAHAVDLLTHYSFDLGTDSANQLVDRWLNHYSASWIRWAVIEALYQGRYKAISVDQILQLWHRRQHPCYHFSYEFERLVCQKFPRNLSSPRKPAIPSANKFPSSNDLAVLPELPPPSKPVVPVEAKWSVFPESTLAESEDVAGLEAETMALEAHLSDPIEDTERLLDATDTLSERVARLHAGVDALIEQATTSLNASTEAVKTKLLEEHPVVVASVENSAVEFEEVAPQSDGLEDANSPIHQFTPLSQPSDFHSKLKAVVEQESGEKMPETL